MAGPFYRNNQEPINLRTFKDQLLYVCPKLRSFFAQPTFYSTSTQCFYYKAFWNFTSVLPLKLCIQKSLTYKLPDFSLMLNHTTRFFWFSSGYGSQTDRPTISNQKVATFLRGRRRLRRQRLCTSVLTPPTPLWTLWELKIYKVNTYIPLTDGAYQLPYAHHHKPLLIRSVSWIQAIHKDRMFWKNLL